MNLFFFIALFSAFLGCDASDNFIFVTPSNVTQASQKMEEGGDITLIFEGGDYADENLIVGLLGNCDSLSFESREKVVFQNFGMEISADCSVSIINSEFAFTGETSMLSFYNGTSLLVSNTTIGGGEDSIHWNSEGEGSTVSIANSLFESSLSIANSEVEISGSTFLIGGKISLQSCTSTLVDCQFKDGQSNVDSIVSSTGNGPSLSLKNCTFYDAQSIILVSSDSQETLLEDCEFRNHAVAHSGTSLLIDGGVSKLSRCKFLGNVEGKTLAVTILSTELEISDSFFADYNSTIYGDVQELLVSSLVLRNSEFYNGGSESGVVSHVHNITVYNCTFKDNSISRDSWFGYYGGACFNYIDIITVYDSVFMNNVANYGGVMADTNYFSFIEFHNSSFYENRATDFTGGALDFSYSVTYFKIENCHFEANSAANSGGAVYLGYQFTSLEECSISDTRFVGNLAELDGGAIKLDRDTSKVVLSKIYGIDNVALGSGGTLSGNNIQGLTLSEFYINGSYAQIGGAIEITARGSTQVQLVNSVIITGVAQVIGGGISISGAVAQLLISNTSFAKCDGNSLGGAILMGGSSRIAEVVFDNMTLDCNTAMKGGGIGIAGNIQKVQITNTVFLKNRGNDGSAVHIDSKIRISSVHLSDCTALKNQIDSGGGSPFHFGKVDNITLERFIAESNTGNNGGVVNSLGFYRFESIDSVFINNSAQTGGAVFLRLDYFNSSVEIFGSLFDSNEAKLQSGALSLSSTVNNQLVPGPIATISSSVFNNQKAEEGSISSISGFFDQIYIEGVKAFKNAAGSGSAFAFGSFGGSLRVLDSNFTRNTGREGAVFHLTSSSTFEAASFSSTHFESNSAFSNGGCVSLESAVNLEISNCDFVKNSARENGGSLSISVIGSKRQLRDGSFNVTVTSSSFSENMAGVGPAVRSNGNLFLNQVKFNYNRLISGAFSDVSLDSDSSAFLTGTTGSFTLASNSSRLFSSNSQLGITCGDAEYQSTFDSTTGSYKCTRIPRSLSAVEIVNPRDSLSGGAIAGIIIGCVVFLSSLR
eukprot:TRINITY_DN3424_c0_g2_i3.p1 TRINITY_DN3424_c0_g2~~TRINITY_DN3424_c0_g2_i3.p1  ORF type:complete len:1048 (+),score=289.31 TRINITY_DN3424_c0_g2_i3:94-3237(+)